MTRLRIDRETVATGAGRTTRRRKLALTGPSLVLSLACGAAPSIGADATADARSMTDAREGDARAIPPDARGEGGTRPSRDPSWRSQVIYLVMVDRFVNGDTSNDRLGIEECFDPSNPRRFHGGDFAGLRSRLDYLAELGVSAIWITPPNRQVGPRGNQCGYHGYWIDFSNPPDDAIEPKLGTPAELEELSADLHSRNMRFVLDLVVNHSGDTAQIHETHPSWFHAEATCAALGNRTVNCPLDHHPDFAQELPEVAEYLTAYSARMFERYGADGLRMDTAKHVSPSYFERSFLPRIRAVRPAMLAIAEIFDGNPSAYVPYLDTGFDSAFNFSLRYALVDAIGHGRSVDVVADSVSTTITRLGSERALDLVSFIDNHDVPRFANEPGLGATNTEIRERLMLALTLIFTLPGIPQLYAGDELGLYGGPDPDNRRDFPGWGFDRDARAGHHPQQAVDGSDQIFDRVRALSALRRSVAALANGSYRELWRQNGASNPNVFAFARGIGGDARIVVVNNADEASNAVDIRVHDLADGTRLVEEIGSGAPASITIESSRMRIALPPRTAGVYRVGTTTAPAAP